MPMTREAGYLPDLPSVFEPVALREGADALDRAAELAPTRGAGTMPWVRSASRLEAAVVLEPERPLAAARLAVLAAASALADALAFLGPPELPIGLRWPTGVTLDGALVGAVRLREPPGAALHLPPDWIAVGVEARIAFPAAIRPGDVPHLTSLEEQGYAGIETEALVAAWARSLMATLSEWQDLGPDPLSRRVLERLEKEPWMGRGPWFWMRKPASWCSRRAPGRRAGPCGRRARRDGLLLRTLRLDPSDGIVFDRAAAPGEWAVPGGFCFWDEDPATMTGKRRQAFRAGFLGLGSFGWSTLVEVAVCEEAEREEALNALAAHLRAHYGAPDEAAARAAAAEEIGFAASLCEGQAPGTALALAREVEKGAQRERFRTLHRASRPAGYSAAVMGTLPVFTAVRVDGEDEVPEHPDLAAENPFAEARR